jgi:hypothetical protein
MDFARPARTVSTSGSSGTYSPVEPDSALMAAFVSACFLDLPEAEATTMPSIIKLAKKVRS